MFTSVSSRLKAKNTKTTLPRIFWNLAVRTNGAFFIKLMRQMLVVIIKA